MKKPMNIINVHHEPDAILIVCEDGRSFRLHMDDPEFAAAALLIARKPLPDRSPPLADSFSPGGNPRRGHG